MRSYLHKAYIIFILLISSLSSFAQSSYKTEISIGTEYRITPIYLQGFDPYIESEPIVNSNEDHQLSGAGVTYSIKHRFNKLKMKAGFSQTFRYDYLYANTGYTLPTPYKINPIKYNIISDYHFTLEKYWFIKDNQISALIGYSLMNRGTNYSQTKIIGYMDSIPTLMITDEDFNFSAYHIAVGYQDHLFRYGLGAYISDSHHFLQPSQIMILYLKMEYIIDFKRKNSSL